jgi:hypothetical protein
MKIAMGALAAVLLTGIGWSATAEAQGLPQGSYLRSCNGARLEGDTLVARCRTVDGREQRSALASVHRCVGDIGNNNGQLQCSYGGPGAQGVPAPGYGDRERYGERERYGRAEPGYGSDRGECRGLRREAEELRERLGREFNPIERARTEGRLREVRAQQERCRYQY